MLAEELSVLDAGTALWNAVRPLLQAALRLDQQDEQYVWHGWSKQAIEKFLHNLPSHCTLLAGVWSIESVADDEQDSERLVLGMVCEVKDGEICSLRTFEALSDPELPPISALEPGFEHARLLMRAAKTQIAPVAWALFTDKAAWDEWVFGVSDECTGSMALNKGELLASLAEQGRCVLMGSQAMHHHL